jgi:hypothetical protein
MKRVGLIDNLVAIDAFRNNRLHECTASEMMRATGGNTGNVAFVFGTRRMLENVITRLEWGWPDQRRKHLDQLVICCANQLGKHADLGPWADRLDKWGLPVVLIGLGAQSENYGQEPQIPAGTKRFLEVVKRLRPDPAVPNIGVRGAYSRQVLHKLGIESVEAGCPSLMISADPRLGRKLLQRQERGAPRRVAVAAGNPWHAVSAFLEKELVEVVERYQGAYVLQHPESLFHMAYGEGDQMPANTVEQFLKAYGGRFDRAGLFEWFRRNAWDFADAPNWMRFLSKFDAVIGPRYHGVALGLQAGVPGCVFTIDSRTRELCEDTAIKSVPVQSLAGATAHALVEMARWSSEDVKRFDTNRAEKARTILDFLLGNGLQPSRHLTLLANS